MHRFLKDIIQTSTEFPCWDASCASTGWDVWHLTFRWLGDTAWGDTRSIVWVDVLDVVE